MTKHRRSQQLMVIGQSLENVGKNLSKSVTLPIVGVAAATLILLFIVGVFGGGK